MFISTPLVDARLDTVQMVTPIKRARGVPCHAKLMEVGGGQHRQAVNLEIYVK
jgi:hypothetical protein